MTVAVIVMALALTGVVAAVVALGIAYVRTVREVRAADEEAVEAHTMALAMANERDMALAVQRRAQAETAIALADLAVVSAATRAPVADPGHRDPGLAPVSGAIAGPVEAA